MTEKSAAQLLDQPIKNPAGRKPTARKKVSRITVGFAIILATLTLGLSAASAASYQSFSDVDFVRWNIARVPGGFQQGSSGDMHVHVYTDGNHRGFQYFVNAENGGLNAASSGAWCPPGQTACGTIFRNVPRGAYTVGLLNSNAGYNRVRVNVTEIRVGTRD